MRWIKSRRWRLSGGILAAGLVAAVLSFLPTSAASTSRSPTCSKQAARTAVFHTALGRKMRRFGAGTPWQVLILYCHELIGTDHVDMAALFACCTTGTPSPVAIFRPERGRWRLSYSAFGEHPLIDDLSLKGRTLIERRPDYDRDDPLCCPDKDTYWAVRWNGQGWSVSRVRP